jgi:hypothetical protein
MGLSRIRGAPRASDLGGRIPTESRSFSSEKSDAPSRLMGGPGDRRTGGHRLQRRRSRVGVGSLGDSLRQVEGVPADEGVLDQPLASLGHVRAVRHLVPLWG